MSPRCYLLRPLAVPVTSWGQVLPADPDAYWEPISVKRAPAAWRRVRAGGGQLPAVWLRAKHGYIHKTGGEVPNDTLKQLRVDMQI